MHKRKYTKHNEPAGTLRANSIRNKFRQQTDTVIDTSGKALCSCQNVLVDIEVLLLKSKITNASFKKNCIDIFPLNVQHQCSRNMFLLSIMRQIYNCLLTFRYITNKCK